jgi:gliding motility-associated-like protein
MKKGQIKFAFLTSGVCLLLLFLPRPSFSQYILNGSATQNNCNCYTLTQAQNTQSGSVWNSNKINLNNSFDFNFNVYLGCQDANGADGIVFILQPISTNVGTTGEGMGFEGVTPSVGISLDTWQNFNRNDPVFDHIDININGTVTHGSDLAGPVQASASSDNIEDCQWHVLRIQWDAVNKIIYSYFDGVLRVQANIDMVSTIFSNNPDVFWGFSAATGGSNNLQQFCTALNPGLTTNYPNDGTCLGNTITFTDSSISFAPIQEYYWDFGDGNTSTLKNPPPHLYAATGIYAVKHVIKGLDGCYSDTLKSNITIGTKPVAAFQVFDTCNGNSPRVNNLSSNVIGAINKWTWWLDGLIFSNAQQPVFPNLSLGVHQIKLVVSSIYNCESDTAYGSFTVKPVPVVDITTPNGCKGMSLNFTAAQSDNQTTITQWNWNFGDGSVSALQNPVHAYNSVGSKSVQFNSIASNGCQSVNISKTINIAFINVKTINDTTILPDFPLTVTSTWQSNSLSTPLFNWSPVTGLNNPAIPSPVTTIKDDITYVVTATINEGCNNSDTVNIKVFKGSAVYIPTAFTPNNDGKNDVLRPLYVGISKIYLFRIYNRWGQLIFSSVTPGEGWDGKVNGVPQASGTYVWMLKAEDMAGKLYQLKGTSTIIR